MLEALHPTATNLDDLPARFLKIGAPFFAAPIADMFNLSLVLFGCPQTLEGGLKIPNTNNSKTTPHG